GTSLRHCPESRHQHHPLTSFDVLTQRVRPHVARFPSYVSGWGFGCRPLSLAEPWWPARERGPQEAGWQRLSADLMVWRRASARRPGPELLGVPYCPDVLDPVACDAEREHRHGDAV